MSENSKKWPEKFSRGDIFSLLVLRTDQNQRYSVGNHIWLRKAGNHHKSIVFLLVKWLKLFIDYQGSHWIIAENHFNSYFHVDKLPKLLYVADVSSRHEFAQVLQGWQKPHYLTWTALTCGCRAISQAFFYAMPSVPGHRKLPGTLKMLPCISLTFRIV